MKTILILFALFVLSPICAQDNRDIRISGIRGYLSGDSLAVNFSLAARNLDIESRDAFFLRPSVNNGRQKVELPALVFSGKKRRQYDLRKQLFAQETTPTVYRILEGIEKDSLYSLDYSATIYSFFHRTPEELTVEFRYDDCCSPVPEIRFETYALPVVLLDAVKTEPVVTNPEPVLWKETLYLEYPENETRILENYGKNREELSKLNQLPADREGTIRITAFASPDGPFDRNDRLAFKRGDNFRKYLLKRCDSMPIRLQHVAEDWEGLKNRILEDPSIPGKQQALEIIDRVGIFAGRETRLTKLLDGRFWKSIEPVRRKLRRIEVEIVLSDL